MISLSTILPARRVPVLAGTHGVVPMGQDVLALLCPDWRVPALVIEAETGRVAHANWRALRLLEQGRSLRIAAGRLVLEPADVNRRFYARLERALASGRDRAAAVIRDETRRAWISATIHIPRGFARDVLAGQLGQDFCAGHLAIVEFATSEDVPDPVVFAALAEALGLAPAEAQLALALVHGRTAAQIAAERGSTVATVRQRIKAVLAKADCTRQSELITLVRRLCPAADQSVA